jgi:hypothetical protein
MLDRARPACPWPFWQQNHSKTCIDPARKTAWHTDKGTKEKSKLRTDQREKQTDDGPKREAN